MTRFATLFLSIVLVTSAYGQSEPIISDGPVVFVDRNTILDNPLNDLRIPIDSRPIVFDVDADGDLDVVTVSAYGVTYLRNEGDVSAPDFMEVTGFSSPFRHIELKPHLSAAIGDLDGDGRLDLITGDYYGALTLYTDQGGAGSPIFVREADQSLLSSIALPGDASTTPSLDPTFADLNGDGQVELVLSGVFGSAEVYGMSGGQLVKDQTLTSQLTNPFYSGAVWEFVDLDGDDDLDGIASAYVIYHVENSGDATSPSYGGQSTTFNSITRQLFDDRTNTQIAFGDFNADGLMDLIAAFKHGHIELKYNTGTSTTESFGVTQFEGPYGEVRTFQISDAAWVDVDRDGDRDVLVAEAGTDRLTMFERVGDRLLEVSSGSNPHANVSMGIYSSIDVGDINGDGYVDLIVGQNDGTIRFLIDDGGPIQQFSEWSNPSGAMSLSSNVQPALSDLDGDGDLDILTAHSWRRAQFIENVGTPTAPDFVLTSRADWVLPNATFLTSGTTTGSEFYDFDADGDDDFFIMLSDSPALYFENTYDEVGSAVFEERQGDTDPLSALRLPEFTKGPEVVDWDGDGDADLAVTSIRGFIFHFENLGVPIARDDLLETDEDTPFLVDVLSNDVDPNGDALTMTIEQSTTQGSLLQINATEWRYLTAQDYNGTDSFTYLITDGSGYAARGSAQIIIHPVNDPPVIEPVSDALQAREDEAFRAEIAYDDVDDDNLTVTFDQLPAWLAADISQTGLVVLEGTPVDGDDGSYEVQVHVSDGTDTTTRTVPIVVEGINDPPTLGVVTAPIAGTVITLSGQIADMYTFEIVGSADEEQADLIFDWEIFRDAALTERLWWVQTMETAFDSSFASLEGLFPEPPVEGSQVDLYLRVSVSDGENRVAGDVIAFSIVRGAYVGVEDESSLPARFSVASVYPNPARGQLWLQVGIEKPREIEVVIHDILGRDVARLPQRRMAAGWHRVGMSTAGLPSGLYAVSVRSETDVQQRMMVIMR